MTDKGAAEGDPVQDQSTDQGTANTPSVSLPGVDIAYEYVRTSYDWAAQRLDAVDSRIQYTITLASAVVVTLPTIVVAMFEDAKPAGSFFFLLAVAAFILMIPIGVLGRYLTDLKVIDPSKLYDGWLHYQPLEFKRLLVYWAGEHFKRNIRIVAIKGRFAAAMMVFLLLEVLFFTLWIATL